MRKIAAENPWEQTPPEALPAESLPGNFVLPSVLHFVDATTENESGSSPLSGHGAMPALPAAMHPFYSTERLGASSRIRASAPPPGIWPLNYLRHALGFRAGPKVCC
ncbi:MAG: hypothetical protein PHS41_08250 [Victivallaceae bacterium]|nr:hypothetical protein [Victivallaceae bacterium]